MCLASSEVPMEIRRAFMEQVVYQYWDSYNPPHAGYRAAYLRQLSPENTLFGWMYNDEMDDLGRSHIPYFVCYYLEGFLQTVHLENILTCLNTGPVAPLPRQAFPVTLETLVIPELGNYQPARKGIAIPSAIREQSYLALDRQELLGLFVPADEEEMATEVKEESNDGNDHLLKSWHEGCLESSDGQKQNMPTSTIAEILMELVSKPIGIQGAVLVSLEGQPLTVPIGMDENRVLILAGTMLYLARSVHEELNWNEIETISVRGQEGHILLSRCNPEVFLLVKAGKALTGLLEGEINRTLKKVKAQLNPNESNEINTIEIDETQVNSNSALKEQSDFERKSKIKYRGNRIS